MKNSPVLWIVVVVVAFGAFLVWARGLSAPSGTSWNATAVQCLPFGHQNIGQHIHPTLTIMVDGVQEPIPENIGVIPACMSEVHTHEANGQIHIETVAKDKSYTLADFYAVWDQDINREGFVHTVMVNDALVPDISTYLMKDGDRIMVTYTKNQ